LAAIADIAANAIRRTTLHEQTEKQLRHLSALRKIDTAINNSQNLQFMVNTVLEQTMSELQVDAASIFLINEQQDKLECLGVCGYYDPVNLHSILSLSGSLAGKAAQARAMLHLPDLTTVDNPILVAEGFQTYYGIPLISKGEVEGVLEVFFRRPFSPQKEWLDFFETLAGQAAIALDNATLF
jgi:GAF domain-containing protein